MNLFTRLLLSVMVLTVGLAGAAEYQLFSVDNSDLPYNGIYCIAFDNDGNIWFGGDKNAATGVAYVSKLSADLSSWTINSQNDLNMAEDRAFYIAFDAAGNSWFCTHYGVTRVKPDGSGEIIDFTDDKYTRSVFVGPFGNVYISQREDNRVDARLWVSADNGDSWTGLSLADMGFTLTESQARPEAYDIRKDSKDQLWICTWYGVTYRNTENVWKSIGNIEGEYTYCMTVDPDDHVWVPDNGTLDLYEILPDESIVVHDSTTLPFLASAVLDIEADGDGNIWCATQGHGLVQLKPDRSYEVFNKETTDGGIPSDSLWHMEIKDGVIWASTPNQGVVRITGIAGGPVSVKPNQAASLPNGFLLHANYPNPFNPGTTLRFDVPHDAFVEVHIYDLLGNRVKTVAADRFAAGSHALLWDGTDESRRPVASGVYIARMMAAQTVWTQKMMLIK